MHAVTAVLSKGESMQPLAGLAVLLLEDEFLIALDAEDILRDMGAASVEVASDVPGAEKLAREQRFDLAILDVNINGVMSFPVADLLAQRGVPVVFATGYELRGRPADAGGQAIYVTKPYTADRLREGIQTAVSRRA